MERISGEVLNRIEKVIEQYNLFNNTKDVCVAYSGGKDSFFLCLALKELGYQVIPVIIDIGYNSNWDTALKNMNIMGMKCIIVELKQISCMFPEIEEELTENLENIKKISKGFYKKATICTPCYNSKMLIIQKWAEKNGVQYIAIGHHAIDSISSLLKSFYMYTDRWVYSHEEFVYENFYELVCSQKGVYDLEKDDFKRSTLNEMLENQIKNHNIGTDEPIVQFIGGTSIKLCRPLFDVFEREIQSFFANQGLQFNESECFITNYREKEHLTPREIIQYHLLKNAPESLLSYLLKLAKKNIDDNGFLRYNVRNNRNTILGTNYKNEFINEIKK